ncbi:MAG: ABC transporter permease [Deltaproteobacteria bacterium]|nr:MAG: ABC transporter permease [Deltaproteobacteria bacterium]
MDLAILDLKRQKGRFLGTVLGVGLLFAIILTMNGIYRGIIFEGTSLLTYTNPDLWVVERNRGGPINEQSILPEFFHYSVAAVPGVVQASPFIVYAVERMLGGQSRRFTIIGYDVFGGLGGPKEIIAGRPIQKAHYEMVAHEKLGVKPGDRVSLGLHTYTVVGLTREAVSPDGEALVYLSLPDAQEALFQRDNEEVRNQRQRSLRSLAAAGFSPSSAEKFLPLLNPSTHQINAVLVKLEPGAAPDQVARRIRDWLFFSVYTTKEEVELTLKGRLSQMTRQLLLFRSLLLLVAVVIVSLVIYTFTLEKIRSIAIMKLIGAPNHLIVRLVMEQSLLLTVLSYGVGWVIVHNTHHLWPKLVLLEPVDDLIVFAVALLGGMFASLLGLWRALRTEPAQALGGH